MVNQVCAGCVFRRSTFAKQANARQFFLEGSQRLSGTIDGQIAATRPQLTEISNAAVALHREHFGRGPGAAKTHLSDNLVVCVLTDVFTPVERTLIEAGQEARVRDTRAVHRAATDAISKERM